ncbi:MAG: NUDIX domain-containing protein [Chloroflexi bacterium]|nr:NUDIX domain-containing protein [Chloroflexota bacterium]
MSKLVYAHKWISLHENENGNGFIKMGDAVMTVPLFEDGTVLFTREYSVAYDEPVLYLPSGAVAPREPLEVTANRELQEEAGYKAARLDYLGELRPGIKYVQWRFLIFLARGLSESKLQGDEKWEITVEWYPLNQFEALIADRQLQDATVIAALFMAQKYLASVGA